MYSMKFNLEAGDGCFFTEEFTSLEYAICFVADECKADWSIHYFEDGCNMEILTGTWA